MLFRIKYGLGGGFGGLTNEEEIEAKSLKDALAYAEEAAKEEYESYSGMCGLFNMEDELEKDPQLTTEELNEMENEDMQSWIEYTTEAVISD